MMKRSMLLFLGLALAASVFAGGGSSSSSRVTIQIPVYDRAFEGWNVTDNFWTRWIQSEFGDKNNINVQYVAIGRSTEVQDFTQMMAAGRAPHIIFHYDMPIAVQYYSQGFFQTLNYNEIQQNAPTYWAKARGMIERYGTIENQRTFFFAERPEADNYTTIIRKDWVERAGYQVENLTSLEVYNQMLTRWRELRLGVAGENLKRNNYTMNYAFRDWPVNERERTLYSELNVADLTWAPMREWLRDQNWKYNNNVIDREFFLRDDDAKTRAEFIAGRTGTFGFYMTANTDVISSLLANNPGAEVAILPPGAQVPQGKVPQGRGYWPFGMIMGINHSATEAQRVAVWKFLNWMSEDANLFALQNGIEGQNYTRGANGLPNRAANFTGASAQSPNTNKDYWCLVVEANSFPTEDMFWAANKALWAPPGYENLVDELISYYRAGAPYRTPDPLWTVPLPAVAEYREDLNVLFQELYVRIVRAPVAQFEATYNAACQEYLNAGYQRILDEKQRVIAAGNYR